MYEDYKIKHIGKNCFQSQSFTHTKKKSQELIVDLTTLILLQNEVYLLEMFSYKRQSFSRNQIKVR